MAYLLDSDVFMQASNMHYQFAFCPAFWSWIEKQNAAKRIFSIDKVLLEIEEGKFGELTPWAKARPELFLKSADLKTLESLKELGVEAQQVVQWEAESGDGSEEIEGVVRAMEVVVVEEGGEAFSALSGV